MRMRKVFCLFLSLSLLASCIQRDHVDRMMTMAGYVERLAETYYRVADKDFYWRNSNDSYRHFVFEQIDDMTWQYVHQGSLADIPHGYFSGEYRGDPLFADVVVTITEKGRSRTVSIRGTHTETHYVTTFRTLDAGIVDGNGTFRVEISHDGVPEGWGEAVFIKGEMTISAGAY